MGSVGYMNKTSSAVMLYTTSYKNIEWIEVASAAEP